MARKRVNTTKLEIIRCAAHLFTEVGYSATSPKMVCEQLDISTGNLTYYFPTKEHLLAEMVEILCSFQWQRMQEEEAQGNDPLRSVVLELTAIASMCEYSAIAKDFFVAVYTSPRCLELVRQNDIARAKTVFGRYCSSWSDDQFRQAETLVSGIEYATMMTTAASPPLSVRIHGAINTVLGIYQVPVGKRMTVIGEALTMDFQTVGQQALTSFKDFVTKTGEQMLEELLRSRYGL